LAVWAWGVQEKEYLDQLQIIGLLGSGAAQVNITSGGRGALRCFQQTVHALIHLLSSLNGLASCVRCALSCCAGLCSSFCTCSGNVMRDDITSLAGVDTIPHSTNMLVAELLSGPAGVQHGAMHAPHLACVCAVVGHASSDTFKSDPPLLTLPASRVP
jgi:hypothetical protein